MRIHNGTLHSKAHPRRGQIKGMKIRQPSSTVAQMVTLLGGTNDAGVGARNRAMRWKGVAGRHHLPGIR